jgi:hypothetical protein
MSSSLPWYFYWIIPVAIILPILGRLIEALLDNRRYAWVGLQDVQTARAAAPPFRPSTGATSTSARRKFRRPSAAPSTTIAKMSSS